MPQLQLSQEVNFEIDEEIQSRPGCQPYCYKFINQLNKNVLTNEYLSYRSNDQCNSPERPLRSLRKSINILIVDDNLFNILALRTLIKRFKFEFNIYESFNGEEAVKLLSNLFEKEVEIQIVLMDINMPILDGYGATKAIRELQSAEKLNLSKIVIVSTNLNTSEAISKGADDYLEKPVDSRTLEKIFRQFGYLNNE